VETAKEARIENQEDFLKRGHGGNKSKSTIHKSSLGVWRHG
jgi:hypothetical protein